MARSVHPGWDILENGSVRASPIFRWDMRKRGWELLEDFGFDPVLNLESRFRSVPCARWGEYISGEELMSRARGELQANLGQQHLEWLIKHPSLIPEELRIGDVDPLAPWPPGELVSSGYLSTVQAVLAGVFPGTVWKTDNGARVVPCLRDQHWGWDIQFYSLEDKNWNSTDHLVRLVGVAP